MAADYGSDLSCVTDLTAEGRTVSGTAVVGEAIARRLSTRRGGLLKYPDYGFDLTEYVNADMSDRDIASLRGAIVNECEKDERVVSAAVDATLLGGVLTVTIELTLSEETLTLVLAASEVSIELLEAS